jgi:hypothetical protein
MNIENLKSIENSGEVIFDFGEQPVSNRYLLNKNDKAPTFSMELRLEKDSGLLHLGKSFPVEELKPQFDWLTCFEPENHLDNMIETIVKLPGISSDSIIGAYTLKRLNNLGYNKTWRIDPKSDLEIKDNFSNVETFQINYNQKSADHIIAKYGLSDVYIIRHVIEHSYDLLGFIEASKKLIKDDGYIVWELPDCERALEFGDCTTIWEEHLYYFTSATFKNLLISVGLEIVHFESVPYALENSLIAIVKKNSNQVSKLEPPTIEIEKEITRALSFAEKLKQRKKNIRKILQEYKDQYGEVAIFGAGHLSVAFLSIFEVSDVISFVIDDNPNKKGLFLPSGNLPIVGSDHLYNGKIKICLLGLNPQNQPAVIKNHQNYLEIGGIFKSIFPGSENKLD